MWHKITIDIIVRMISFILDWAEWGLSTFRRVYCSHFMMVLLHIKYDYSKPKQFCSVKTDLKKILNQFFKFIGVAVNIKYTSTSKNWTSNRTGTLALWSPRTFTLDWLLFHLSADSFETQNSCTSCDNHPVYGHSVRNVCTEHCLWIYATEM